MPQTTSEQKGSRDNPYCLDERMMGALLRLVNLPVRAHERTLAWQSEVLSQNDQYHRKVLLSQGRADFHTGKNGLSDADLVLLYCHYYLQMHLASNCFVLDRCQSVVGRKLPFLSHNSAVVDFGCGPLTFGLALAMHAELQSPLPHYIGLDRSEAMLSIAGKFAKRTELFHPATTARFLCGSEDSPKLVDVVSRLVSSDPRGEIVLNFSYFFASPWLDSKRLNATVEELLAALAGRRVWCFFQNPPGHGLNNKWYNFRHHFADHFDIVEERQVENHYQFCNFSRAESPQWEQRPATRLFYSILVSRR
jgi:hypothetical protein